MTILQWLMHHLNRGDIPGLTWISRDTFRVDWVHCGNHDWSQEKAQVFIQYGQHRDKTNTRNIRDHTKKEVEIYKRNFRSALNKYKNSIESISTKTEKDSTDPHRVYRFKANTKPKTSFTTTVKNIPSSIHTNSMEVIPCWNELLVCSHESEESDSDYSAKGGSPNAVPDDDLTVPDDDLAVPDDDLAAPDNYHTNNKDHSGIIAVSIHSAHLNYTDHTSANTYSKYPHSTATTGNVHQLQYPVQMTSPTMHLPEDTFMGNFNSVTDTRVVDPGGVLNSSVNGISTNALSTDTLNENRNGVHQIHEIPGQINAPSPAEALSRAIPDVIQSMNGLNQRDQSMSESSLEFPSDLFEQSRELIGSTVFDAIFNEKLPACDHFISLNDKLGYEAENCRLASSNSEDNHNILKPVPLCETHTCNDKGIMNIDIIARNHIISSTHIENPNGCMVLNYTQADEKLSNAEAKQCFGVGHRDRDKIPLDTWKTSLQRLLGPNQQNVLQKAEKIMANVSRPVVLKCENGDIKIERYCTASVHSTLRLSREAPKSIKRFDKVRQPKTLFSGSNYFDHSLTLFENNETNAPEPSTGVFLVIGQKCTTKFEDEFEKALLVLCVTSCEAHRQLTRVKEEKARSLSMTCSLPNDVDELIEKTRKVQI